MNAWIDRSPDIDQVAAAWVKASKQMKDVVKTKTANTGKFSYSYADLAEVLQMVRPVLAENDLVLTQTAESHEVAVRVFTTILHSSGQYITASPTQLPTGDTAQATGSAFSYARRYALMAFLGLAAEDDDGAQASATPRKKPGSVVLAPRTEQEGWIREMMVGMPKPLLDDTRRQFKEKFGCGLSDLPESEHARAYDWMLYHLSPKEGA